MTTITNTFYKTCLYCALIACIAIGAFFIQTQVVHAQVNGIQHEALMNLVESFVGTPRVLSAVTPDVIIEGLENNTWRQGDSKTVRWIPQYIVSPTVNIYLYFKSGSNGQWIYMRPLASGIGNGGVYVVTMPTTNVYGDETVEYKIAVGLNSGWSFNDSNTFKIDFIEDEDREEVFLYAYTSPAGAGTVTISPDKDDYYVGDTITATYTTNRGYQFDRWQINGVDSGSASSKTITLTEDEYTVGAIYSQNDGSDPDQDDDEQTVSANVTIDDMRSGQWAYGTRKKVEWEEDVFGSRIDIAVCGSSADTCVILEDNIENEGEINLSMSGFAFSGRALTDRYLEIRNNRNLTGWFVQNPEYQSEEFDIVDEEAEEPVTSSDAPRISFVRGGSSRGADVLTGRFSITFDVYNRDDEDIFIDKDLMYAENYSYSRESAVMLYTRSGEEMSDEEKINDFGIYSTQSDSGDTRDAYRVKPGETRQFYVDATFKVSEYGSYYIKLNSLRWDTDGDDNSARNIITGSQLNDLKSGSQSLGISTVVSSVCPYTFTKNFSLGDWDFEVKKVQQFLNEKGFRVALNGAGSPGYESLYFGPATQAAVIRFQNEYFNEIIRVAGLTAANGVWGPASRAQANRMCTGSVSGANITISGLGSDSEWVLGDSHTVRWNRATFVENDTSYRVDIGLCGEGWGDCVTLVEDSNNDGVHYVEMSGFNTTSDFDGYLIMRRHTENDWSIGGRGSFRSAKFTVIVDEEDIEDANVVIQGLSDGVWYLGEQKRITWNSRFYTDAGIDEVDITLIRRSASSNTWSVVDSIYRDFSVINGEYTFSLSSVNLGNTTDRYAIQVGNYRSNDFQLLSATSVTPDIEIEGLGNNIVWRSGEQHCVTWNPGAYDQTVDIILWRYSDGPSRWISDSLLSNDYDATTGRACYTLRKGEVPPAYGNIYKIGVGRGEDKSSPAFYFWDALPEDTSTQETEPTEPTTPTEPTGYSEPEILGLETQGSLENIWTIGLSKPVKWDDGAVNRDTVDIMLCSNSECFMYLARNIANDGLHYVTVLDSYARSYYRIGIVGYGTASIGVNLDSRNTSEHFILRD